VPQKDDRRLATRLFDRFIWPRQHGEYWMFNEGENRRQRPSEIYSWLGIKCVDQANETLDHVKAIAQDTADRAAAADRRATTIAGTVAIAASLTLSGGALALDKNKLTDVDTRIVLAAFYALRALVATRRWNSDKPDDLQEPACGPRPAMVGAGASRNRRPGRAGGDRGRLVLVVAAQRCGRRA
jgi:hypothetical protein